MWQFLMNTALASAAKAMLMPPKDLNPDEDRLVREDHKAWEEQQRQMEHDRILEQHRQETFVPEPSIFDPATWSDPTSPMHDPSTYDSGHSGYDSGSSSGGDSGSSD
jgi:hypothetical protein